MKNSLIAFGLMTLAVVGLSINHNARQAGPFFVGLTPEQTAVLNRLAVVQIPDGQGGTVEALRCTSNFQVVNGVGTTDSLNALGNLIVGYNELGSATGTDIRFGSHNIVAGLKNNYTSYGGMVMGQSNALTQPMSSVLGGTLNNPSSAESIVIGGNQNGTGGQYAVTVGGQSNFAIAANSVVVGGTVNIANGTNSVVSGGNTRLAGGTDDWVAGTLFENN